MAKAPQRQKAAVGATRTVSVSFSGQLDDGELLTGTPTVTEATTTDLTISSVSLNTSARVINGVSVPANEAVLCSVTGFVEANFPYTLNVSCGTDATPAQTLPNQVVITKDA